MKSDNQCRVLCLLIAVLIIVATVTTAFAANVTGTVQNLSSSSGKVYVGLINSWGEIQYGVSVQPVGTAVTPFSIKGVRDDTYTLVAFVDRLGDGQYHANNPADMVPAQVSGGDLDADPLTLYSLESEILPTDALGTPLVLPASGGAIVIIDHAYDAGGGIIADSYDVNCNSGAITRNVAASMTGDESAVLTLGGLSNDTELSCTVTPVINGTPRGAFTSVPSAPVQVGETCFIFGTCDSGATVTGRVDLSDFSGGELTGKTLLVVVSDWSSNDYIYLWEKQNPSTSEIYTIPGVIPSAHAYRIELFLLDTAPGVFSAGMFTLNERTEHRRLLVETNDPVTAPDVKLPKRNATISVNTVSEFGPDWHGYSLEFEYGDCAKRAVNITLSNDTGSALPTGGISVAGNSGYLHVFNVDQPQAGDSYSADVMYADGTSETLTATVIKGTIDDYLAQSFPASNVRFSDPDNPVFGWWYSLPQTILPYTVDLDASNYWVENRTSATNWLTVPGPVDWFSVTLEDMLGDKLRFNSGVANQVSGPHITSFSPTTGASYPSATSVIITGSGFTGATGVKFNGTSAGFTVNSDTQITATVPNGASRGPISVTGSSGVTGASPGAFEKKGYLTGTITDTAAATLNGILVKAIGTASEGIPQAAGTSNSSGIYLLNPPAGIPLILKLSGDGYRDSYSRYFSVTNSSLGTDFTMYTTANITSWTAADSSFEDVVSGTAGMIRGRVYDPSVPQNVGGATVSVRSLNYPDGNPNYKVFYANDSNAPVSQATRSTTNTNGIFFVTGIEQGDIVAVFADKTDYAFNPSYFQVFNGAISQGRIVGGVMPTVTFSPAGGAVLSGTPVTITLNPTTGTVFYTTDGRDPRYYGAALTNGQSFTLDTPGDVQVRYLVRNAAGIYSNPETASFNVAPPDTEPPTVFATPPAYTISVPTTFKSAVFPLNVPFTASEPSTIYYTTNGADPTTSPQGTLIVSSNWGTSEGIEISAGQTLKFYAKDASNNNSEVQQITYSTTSAASFQGTVYDSAFAAISGATVSMMGNPSISSSSGPDGSFTLDNLPQAQSLTLKVENTPLGKQDTYSHIMTINSPTLTGRSFQLFTLAEMQGWGHEAGTGVIHGTVQQGSAGGGEPIGGAHVSVTGSTGSYTVLYDDGTGMTPGNGTSTSANGVFYIVGVIPGDILTITASRTGFTFLTRYFQGHADAVSYGTIIGTVDPPPSISGITYYGYNGTAHYAISTVGYDISATDNGPISYLVTMDDSTPSLSNPNWSGASYWEETGRSAGTYTRYAWVKDATGSIVGPTMISFTVDFTSPTTTATPSSTPASGYYVPGTTVNVSLTPSEAGVTYYTINGSDPTTGSSVYGGAIPVTLTTVLKFFSVDLAGNTESSVSSATLSFGRVKVSGTVSAYNALTAAIGGIDATDRIITAKADIFAENVVVNKPLLAMKLNGGYDATLAGTPGGTTVIDGSLKIRAGALRVQKLAIR